MRCVFIMLIQWASSKPMREYGSQSGEGTARRAPPSAMHRMPPCLRVEMCDGP